MPGQLLPTDQMELAKATPKVVEAERALKEEDFVPPASPIEFSPIESAATYGFLCVPRGYNGDGHPSPRRQWIFFLAGEMAFEVADGQVLRAGPGSAMLLEDTTGREHRSRVVSDTAAVLAAVQL